ncbi:hypothetical protein Tco_1212389 [Tanacetum coccineum]
MSNQTNDLKNMMASFFQMNTASSSSSGPLSSNTIANPRGDLKAITTRSGVSYDGPPIPLPFSSLPKVVEQEPEVTKDTVQPTKTPVNENCSAVIPKKLPEKLGDPGKFLIPCDFPELVECLTLADLDRSTTRLAGIAEDVFVKVGKFHFPADFVVVDYMSILRYFYNDAKSVNRIDVIDVSCVEYAQEVLGFAYSSTSGNPTLSLDPIISTSFLSLTPFEGGDFILEEIEACLTNDSIPLGIDDADFNPEGDLLLLENLLNDDPSSPLPSKELHFEEIKTIKSSIDDPP